MISLIILALLCAILGFTLFSLANKKHYAVAFTDAEPSTACQVVLHIVGWMFLVIALALCVKLWSGEIGTTVWVGMLQLSSVLVSVALTYAPRIYRGICRYGMVGIIWARHS